jgi:hypothetical protein
MTGNGMRVHVIFDVPDAENLDDAMARLGLVEGPEGVSAVIYTPPTGTRIFSYTGIWYNIIGGTSAGEQMERTTTYVPETKA